MDSFVAQKRRKRKIVPSDGEEFTILKESFINQVALRIQICPKKGIIGLPLHSYSGDGIESINPLLGMGLDG